MNHGFPLLSRWADLDRENRMLITEALVALSAASLAIRLLSFRRVVRMMESRQQRRTGSAPAERDDVTNRCAWAVAVSANRVPWRAVCFQRGLALHWMLRRRGVPSTLHYGVAKGGEKGLQAHVWVSVCERIVIGGEEAPRFACVATFPASS